MATAIASIRGLLPRVVSNQAVESPDLSRHLVGDPPK